MNFCRSCGARVVGPYCTQCGAPTSLDASATAPPSVAPPAEPPVAGGAPAPASLNVTPTVSTKPLPVGPERQSLVRETRWVMVAFLVPVVVSAVVVFSEHASGVADIARFPTYVAGHPLTNMLLGILAYLPVAAVVPLGLYLLARTGQDRHELGLEPPSFTRDVIPGVGLGLAAFGVELILILIVHGLLINDPSLFLSPSIQHIPKYYVIWGLVISAVTAVTEEVMVNGYLITRLAQLGWSPRASLILSLILRTSYHVYYGIGFIFTIPFGFFVTRSFQKHGKLMRPIVTHFLYDAVLITISILTLK